MEGTTLLWMSMCDDCIDNQLLTDNKTLLLKKFICVFSGLLNWTVVIPHQYPIGRCLLNNFLRLLAMFTSNIEGAGFSERTIPGMIKKTIDFMDCRTP